MSLYYHISINKCNMIPDYFKVDIVNSENI